MKRLTADGDADKSNRGGPEKPQDKGEQTLPRRYAVIRRTLPEDDVEKTEMRFVVYKKPTGKLDKQAFFDEISFFLKEQSADMAYEDQKDNGDSAPGSTVEEIPKTPTTTTGESKATTPSSAPVSTDAASASSSKATESSGKPQSSLSEASVDAMSAEHHDKKCNDAEAIRRAMPLLEELVGYFRGMEKSSGRKDASAMRQTSEQVLNDAQQTLTKGGAIGKGLVGRVKALNELATKTRNSTAPSNAKSKKKT